MARKNNSEKELKYEIILAEPLTEDELDSLALLFAKAIVREMLKKGQEVQNKDSPKLLKKSSSKA
jgi:hypothetical protein